MRTRRDWNARLWRFSLVLALAIAAVLAGQGQAHECAYAAVDACVSPPAAPAGAEVELDVIGTARTGMEICVVWNDRRTAAALASQTAPHMPRSTCPPPLPVADTSEVAVCLQDFSRDGARECYLRRPRDEQIELRSFHVSEADRVLPEGLAFERRVTFRVPEVPPGLYMISWLDCPPGDCAHVVLTGFRVLPSVDDPEPTESSETSAEEPIVNPPQPSTGGDDDTRVAGPPEADRSDGGSGLWAFALGGALGALLVASGLLWFRQRQR